MCFNEKDEINFIWIISDLHIVQTHKYYTDKPALVNTMNTRTQDGCNVPIYTSAEILHNERLFLAAIVVYNVLFNVIK